MNKNRITFYIIAAAEVHRSLCDHHIRLQLDNSPVVRLSELTYWAS